jgi:hypothetical protein
MMKTAIWAVGVAALGLAGAALAQTPPPCPCDASKIQRTDVATLVTGKTACAVRGSERWQEFHQSGGSLIDYKLGPGSTTDPSEKVGTWLAGKASRTNPLATVTYNYGSGGTYAYAVCAPNATTAGPFLFCNISTNEKFDPVTLKAGQVPC